jgi:hypothetical protein
MRLLAVVAAIGALSQPAMAQSPDCRSMPNPSARLACYDKAAAIPAAATAAPAKPVTAAPAAKGDSAKKADSAKYVDSIADEDKLMNSRLHNICRGC